MKILVLNCGSSSIKYKLYDTTQNQTLASGGVEKIGLEGSFLKHKQSNGKKTEQTQPIPTHTEGIAAVLATLTDTSIGCLHNLNEIDAVGHRVVHGGEQFKESMLLTADVLDGIKAMSDLAPLHNPANQKGIEAISQQLPTVPQVAVFDTAFHQTMPPHAYLYALPYRYYEQYGLRRYGFHGTSHRYVAQRAYDFLKLDPSHSRIITAHIGNGASIAAIENSRCIDTSMGLTPTEGLMMGTRCGDVDPGALLYLMEKEQLDAKKLSNLVNRQSGVLGISELSSDMRTIREALADGNARASLTMDMYNYRITKQIGAYTAAMNGVDAIIFTGGVGENQVQTRTYVANHLTYLGAEYDKEKIAICGEEIVFSTSSSHIKMAVIPTDEEWMIALDTERLTAKD
ncbi:MAG: acetate kinase [Bacteroidales bacterium]|nr:acetate kinase [Bacteroidales bacterium]